MQWLKMLRQGKAQRSNRAIRQSHIQSICSGKLWFQDLFGWPKYTMHELRCEWARMACESADLLFKSFQLGAHMLSAVLPNYLADSQKRRARATDLSRGGSVHSSHVQALQCLRRQRCCKEDRRPRVLKMQWSNSAHATLLCLPLLQNNASDKRSSRQAARLSNTLLQSVGQFSLSTMRYCTS